MIELKQLKLYSTNYNFYLTVVKILWRSTTNVVVSFPLWITVAMETGQWQPGLLVNVCSVCLLMPSSPFVISQGGDLFKQGKLSGAVTDQPDTEWLNMTDIADAERTPLLTDDQFMICTPGFPSEDSARSVHFNEVLKEAIEAINCSVFPERIYQGSSGSYFVKSRDGVSKYWANLHGFWFCITHSFLAQLYNFILCAFGCPNEIEYLAFEGFRISWLACSNNVLNPRFWTLFSTVIVFMHRNLLAMMVRILASMAFTIDFQYGLEVIFLLVALLRLLQNRRITRTLIYISGKNFQPSRCNLLPKGSVKVVLTLTALGHKKFAP